MIGTERTGDVLVEFTGGTDIIAKQVLHFGERVSHELGNQWAWLITLKEEVTCAG
ncbi:hypothetical protein [Heyndrickxia oleronia]|uniref:hypothetical protein n=1 Tax=Heyndrickxia oleronia TaxID=38875 RepID=UPI00246991DB|nr:hypothetical protein [Heyndrickxia oleronia]